MTPSKLTKKPALMQIGSSPVKLTNCCCLGICSVFRKSYTKLIFSYGFVACVRAAQVCLAVCICLGCAKQMDYMEHSGAT